MIAQHTPGRALLDEDEPIVRGEDGERIANCYRWFDGDPAKTPEETGMANARRLVACWNACEGISTYELERHAGDPTPVFALLTETWAQRDELLAALKRIDSMCKKPIRYGSIDVQEAARAAIAKAGGEA
jgi:hypothetical protein